MTGLRYYCELEQKRYDYLTPAEQIDRERDRAEKLAAKLRSLGIDLDTI